MTATNPQTGDSKTGTKVMTMLEAINDAMKAEMRNDDRVVVAHLDLHGVVDGLEHRHDLGAGLAVARLWVGSSHWYVLLVVRS